MPRKILALACLVSLSEAFAHAQVRQPGRHDEAVSFIGMRLDALLGLFGAPSAVHAARGAEEWQDDVVFVYPQGDFYIHRDRVWQVGFSSLGGMRVGDPRAVASLVLGDAAQDHGDFVIYPLQPLPGTGWPVAMRVSFSAGRIAAIFVYRTDF